MRRDLIALPDSSKVWVYQSNKIIDDETTDKIKSDVYDFTMNWQSHGVELDCYGHLFHNIFLVLVADDNNHIGGCSIDSSVHFVKSLESKYNLHFFDRLCYCYMQDEKIDFVKSRELKTKILDGDIDGQTLMFNNLVTNKQAFLNEWIMPMSETWYSRYLK